MDSPDARVLALRTFRSHSAEASEAFGAALARGVAAGLGSADAVHSPSFTLMHTYAGRLPIYHFDAWMEGRERAFLDGGGAEWLDGGGVALIEWASRVVPWLPLPRLGVLLEHGDAQAPDRRTLTLVALGRPVPTGTGDSRAEAMAALVTGLRLSAVPCAPGQIEEP